MPSRFNSLFKGSKLEENSVESKFTPSELLFKPIIWDQKTSQYLVFRDRLELTEWYKLIPKSEKWYHETVLGHIPQKLHFDIDSPSSMIDTIPDNIVPAIVDISDQFAILLGEDYVVLPEAKSAIPLRLSKITHIMNTIVDAILDELYFTYLNIEDFIPTRDNLVVTDSSGATDSGYKYSFHIISHVYHFVDYYEAQAFTAGVIKRLPEIIRPFVDPNVNKKTQNFRLLESAKPGSTRFKEITSIFNTNVNVLFQDLLLTAPYGVNPLHRVYTEYTNTKNEILSSLNVNDSMLKVILAYVEEQGVSTGHSFSEIRNTLLCFTRVSPSYCRICTEIHHNDNSLMISINIASGKEESSCSVYEHCRQLRGGRYIGDVLLQQEDLRTVEVFKTTKTYSKNDDVRTHDRINTRINKIKQGAINPHDAMYSLFENLPDIQKTVYSEDSMRDYEKVPTLAILAQMKLGKTKALRNYIDNYFPAGGLETKIIRFITFRQTFSKSISNAFSEFISYTDVTGVINQRSNPRLIIQVESLHRLEINNTTEPIDLLILDESESIYGQFSSGLHKNFNASFAAFQWLMKTAKNVIAMDANLGDRSYQVFNLMRPQFPIHLHWNKYARAYEDIYYFTSDQSLWLGKLYRQLREDKKIVIPTNSLAEARILKENICREFPNKNVMLYSGDMTQSEKVKHFADVHKYWGNLDVLIYTPTCTAGVSFELKHFDALYGYYSDTSCDTETCRQMLSRVRNIKSHEHHICIRAAGASLPTKVSDIRNSLYNKRSKLYNIFDTSSLQFEYDDSGQIKFYESNYFFLWLETIRINNLSRNDFAYRFIDQVADTGASIFTYDVNDKEDLKLESATLSKIHRETRIDLKIARCNVVAVSPDISIETAELIKDQMSNNTVDVDPNMKLSYEKYLLRDTYDWHNRPLDTNFVSLYQTPDARRVYNNLLRIAESKSCQDSLKAIQIKERERYEFIMGCKNDFRSEGRDLIYDKGNYILQSHRYAILLLSICGFECILDSNYNRAELIEARFRASICNLKKISKELASEFTILQPNFEKINKEVEPIAFISNMLRIVNKILRHMYGLQVNKKQFIGDGNKYISYSLKQTKVGKLFIFSKEPDTSVNNPKPHIVSNLCKYKINPINEFLQNAFYENLKKFESSPDNFQEIIENAPNPEPIYVDTEENNTLQEVDLIKLLYG